MKARTVIISFIVTCAVSIMSGQSPRRRATPVNTAATTTQAVNETATDTSRINAKRRAASISYLDERGRTIFVDTVTGEEWTDSTVINRVPKMEYPLFHALTVGVNVWDPIMRAFGQKFGIADAWAELSLHNRYKPIVEVGLGTADNTPSGMNFTYKSPMSVYFRLGANYNFLYNSNPAYSVYAGLRYGFSPFTYHVDNVHLNDSYWDESSVFDIPSQNVTAGWLEVIFGLRVKIWGPVSAGWTIKYHSIIHETKSSYGKPWYIPGYGSRNGALTGSFSISYTFGLGHLNKQKDEGVITEISETPAESESDAGISADTEKTPAE